MSNNKKHPDVVLLNKGNKESFIAEYLNTVEIPEIPISLLDSVFVTLQSGEKFKIRRSALKNTINFDTLPEDLNMLGVPENVKTVEILLDLEDADKRIKLEASQMLSDLFEE